MRRASPPRRGAAAPGASAVPASRLGIFHAGDFAVWLRPMAVPTAVPVAPEVRVASAAGVCRSGSAAVGLTEHPVLPAGGAEAELTKGGAGGDNTTLPRRRRIKELPRWGKRGRWAR